MREGKAKLEDDFSLRDFLHPQCGKGGSGGGSPEVGNLEELPPGLREHC